MAREISELRQLMEIAGSSGQILSELNRRYSSLEERTQWALLSADFQLHAGRSAQFAEPFAELHREQRKAIAGLPELLAEKAGAPKPANDSKPLRV